MKLNFYKLIRPLLFLLDEERSHNITLWALSHGIAVSMAHSLFHKTLKLQTQCLGLSFPNPIGVAAGFDKNGVCPETLWSIGFGFVEVGTVTPRPQSGHPKPRIFRLTQDNALINKLGFNNEGFEKVLNRLNAIKTRQGILGVNIGPNKNSPDYIQDYVQGIKAFESIADYITLNISSPNTEGLRNLEKDTNLEKLLQSIASVRSKKPILLKIDPDLARENLKHLISRAKNYGIQGIIVSNTTHSRPKNLLSKNKKRDGGLSGKPLFESSTKQLQAANRESKGDLTLIGAGGIDSPSSLRKKYEAGADLFQIYTGLVYQGPQLLGALLEEATSFERKTMRPLERS